MKIKIIGIAMLVFILFLAQGFSQIEDKKKSYVGKDIIFLIDLSGSMNKNNLFREVKKSIKDALAKGVENGDHVILMGFHSEVIIIADQQIQGGIEDVFELNKKIDGLTANGRWTYITKVLDITAKQLENLNRADPNSVKVVYLFTDGKNEPPPTETNPITYNDLTRKYFSTFTAKNAYTYIFKFGVEVEDKEENTFIDTTGITVTNFDKENFKSISIASIEPTQINTEFREEATGVLADTLHFKIGYGKFQKPVAVSFGISVPYLKLVANSSVKLSRVGQVLKIPFVLNYAGLPEHGRIPIAVRYNKNEGYVIPDSIVFRYFKLPNPKTASAPVLPVAKAPHRPLDKRFLYLVPVVLLLAGFLLWCKWLKPTFDLDAQIVYDNAGNKMPYSLEPLTGFCRKAVSVGPDQDIDIPTEGATFTVYPKSNNRILIKINEGFYYYDDETGTQKQLLEGDQYLIDDYDFTMYNSEHKLIINNTGV